MRRATRVLAYAVGTYALLWTAYVAKSAAGIDIIRDGVHHGPIFPYSDPIVAWLKRV